MRPIPNHKPIVGKALLNKRTCKLKNIPDGKYYLLSCAIKKSNNPLDYFKFDKALRGMVEESINFPSMEEKKFKIVLIGDGSESEKEKIIDCIKHLKLEDRVFLLGIKSNIYSIIKSVDINILSSKFEGLSISSIEGMASGKPLSISFI